MRQRSWRLRPGPSCPDAMRAGHRRTRSRSMRSVSRSSPATTRRTSRDEPRPDRLAVTKALTAVDADHPELRAARDLGIPVEPWQQVIADAAVGRRLVAVAGTHGKSTTAGWLVHVLAEAGRILGVRRSVAAGSADGRHVGHGQDGARRRLRRGGRRVRRELRRVPTRARGPDQHRMGSPRRLRGRHRRPRGVRCLARRDAARWDARRERFGSRGRGDPLATGARSPDRGPDGRARRGQACGRGPPRDRRRGGHDRHDARDRWPRR